jgi:hypothetical protein
MVIVLTSALAKHGVRTKHGGGTWVVALVAENLFLRKQLALFSGRQDKTTPDNGLISSSDGRAR